MIKDEEQLQERLRNGDRKAMEQLYVAYKEVFLSFFRSRTSGKVDLEDLYQDSVIALFQNYVLNQLQLKSGTVRTYLFAIGKNKVAAKFNEPSLFSKDELEVPVEGFEMDKEEFTTEQELLYKGYRNLGDKCKEMLRLYYYRGLTDKEIVEQTEYKDENTIKSYRSRCLKKLKEKIHAKRK